MDYSGEQGHEPRRGAAAALVYGVVSKLDSGLVPPCTALLLILHYNSDLHEAVLVPYRTSLVMSYLSSAVINSHE